MYRAVLIVLLFVHAEYATQATPVCDFEKFNTQVQEILTKEMLTSERAREISQNFTELRNILGNQWGGADIYSYGAIVNGLGTKTSDVDVYVRIPNYNTSADKYLVKESAKLLQNYPEKYRNIQAKLNVSVPMLTFYDIAKKISIDVTFRNYYSVVNTKMITYYLNLDKRNLPLAAIVKMWCKVHRLTGPKLTPNYAIYLMIVFYLQQKKMCPSGFEIQAHLQPRIFDKWNVGFQEISFNTENKENLYELIGGFFRYYREFDFSKDCVSPFAGRPVAKDDFIKLNSIPKEFSMMRTKFKRGDQLNITLHTRMCIQDILQHNLNLVRRLGKKKVSRFVGHLKTAAKMYDELPCEQFIKMIFVNDSQDEIESSENNINIEL